MSDLTLYINNQIIPDEDILKYPKEKQSLHDNRKILPPEMSFTLDNVNKANYDDRYEGSFFYGIDWYGDSVKLYDNSINRYIFEGRLTNLIANDGAGELEIESSNYLTDLREKTCVYSNTSDKTPARIIYEILTDADNGAIDEDLIVYDGFQNAINIQDANSVYCNVNFNASNSKNIMSVLNELLRITQCHLYSKKNLIYLYQWEEYSGEIAVEVADRHIIPKSFKQYYDDTNVFNSYHVAYDNAGTVAFSEDTDTTSISKYGERVFKVPDEDVDSTSSNDFKILVRNVTGAAYLGDLAMSRYKDQKKMFDFRIVDTLNYLELGDQIDLSFDLFVREPAHLIVREYDRRKKEIKIKGEFINLPEEYYSRDTTAPSPVEMISAIPSGNGSALLKWTKNTDTDFLGYKVYFTTSPGMWFHEECNKGKSPIEIKTEQLSEDGYIYTELFQLNSGAQYYFKITAYDTSFNESDYSNIKSCTVWDSSDGYFNVYRLSGGFATGIFLDEDNSEGGAPLVEWGTFPYTLPFNLKPCSVYESGLNYNADGMSLISWRGSGDSNDIQFQYRTSEDSVSWSNWSTAIDAIGNNQVNFGGAKYVQWRFYFRSTLWIDTDYFIIKELY